MWVISLDMMNPQYFYGFFNWIWALRLMLQQSRFLYVEIFYVFYFRGVFVFSCVAPFFFLFLFQSICNFYWIQTNHYTGAAFYDVIHLLVLHSWEVYTLYFMIHLKLLSWSELQLGFPHYNIGKLSNLHNHQTRQMFIQKLNVLFVCSGHLSFIFTVTSSPYNKPFQGNPNTLRWTRS